MKIRHKDAVAAGDKYYFNGKSCINGHISKRFTSTRACYECLELSKKQYRSLPENKQKAIDYSRKYRNDNKDTLEIKRRKNYELRCEVLRTHSRKWKEKNKDRVSKYASEYKKNNPAGNAARAAKYTAAKIRATPAWADMLEISKIYEVASKLTTETGIKHEVDHEYPLRGKNVSGLHVQNNLRVIPSYLNRKKYNKHPDDIVGYTKLVADTLITDEVRT